MEVKRMTRRKGKLVKEERGGAGRQNFAATPGKSLSLKTSIGKHTFGHFVSLLSDIQINLLFVHTRRQKRSDSSVLFYYIGIYVELA